MSPRELLIATTPSIAPARALEALLPEQADVRQGSLHTITEIVSHLAFWQDWFRGRCEGGADPMPASAALGWMPPVPGSWLDIRRRFLDGLARIAALGEREDHARTTSGR
jgi:hypothetical protein